MSREIRIDGDAIISGAISVIERDGYAAVTARSVATELGISTQPIYREFGDMRGLKAAALDRGWKIFTEYVAGEAEEQAAKYVMFAVERKNMFNFLFRDRNVAYSGLDDMAHKLVEGTDIIDRLTVITGLERDKVYRLHLFVWMALHGLASMSADNDVSFGSNDMTEIKKFAVDMTRAVSMYLREVGV